MYRHAFTLVMVVVAGALLSVVVAWRCAVSGGGSGFETLDPADTKKLWGRYVPGRDPTQYLQGTANQGSGISWLVLSQESPTDSEAFEFYVCVVTRAGWPMRCLEGQQHEYMQGLQGRGHTVAVWQLPRSEYLPHRWSGQAFPLSPLPIGLLLNTAFFSALTWATVRLGARIQRRTRLDRGECPRCRYHQVPPYSSQPTPCSECGYRYRHAVHARPRQILRLWMVPLVIPQLLLVLLWFLGVVDWPWLRFQFHYAEPLLTVASALSVTIAVVWVTAISHSAYPDRPPFQRRYLSVSLATVISVTAYIAVFAVVLRAGL